MKLKRLTITEDGNVESIFILTPEQYYSLVQHAINDLMVRGVLDIMDMSEEEIKKIKDEQDSEVRKKFLEQVDAKDLHQA